MNGIAKGDPVIVEQSGFPSYTAGRTNSSALPGAPQNLRLRHGPLSGTIVARYRQQGQRSTNEAQTCTGDPTVESNWQYAEAYRNGRALIRGLPVGSTVWVRIRTAGPGGAMRPWSDPGKIVVI